MVKEIILPKLGQTMEEGTIIEWLKTEGDPVERGEVLFTLESDKATLDVESPGKGVLRRILVPAGEAVPVLTVVGLVTKTPNEDLSTYDMQSADPTAADAEEEAESQTPGLVGPSESQEEGSEPSRIFASPRARRRARQEGVAIEELTGTGPRGRIVEQDVLAHLAAGPRATPVAQRLASHTGIELVGIAGSGPGGRITKADVEQTIDARESQPEPASSPGVLRDVPMRGIRARIAQRMHTSHQETAPVTLTTEADATALVDARERLKAALVDDLGFNLGYNDLLIKLVARALRAFPYMNASLDPSGGEDGASIRYLEDVNVALAVDTEQGLLVPVIRNADAKPVTEIARDLREVVRRAREGQATPDELTGSTFTITNLGMHEIDAFTPIINLPEAAILGVGRIKARPAVDMGELCVRQTVWLSLTFDHRLVDGAPAARFLQHVKGLIEEPYLLVA